MSNKNAVKAIAGSLMATAAPAGVAAVAAPAPMLASAPVVGTAFAVVGSAVYLGSANKAEAQVCTVPGRCNPPVVVDPNPPTGGDVNNDIDIRNDNNNQNTNQNNNTAHGGAGGQGGQGGQGGNGYGGQGGVGNGYGGNVGNINAGNINIEDRLQAPNVSGSASGCLGYIGGSVPGAGLSFSKYNERCGAMEFSTTSLEAATSAPTCDERYEHFVTARMGAAGSNKFLQRSLSNNLPTKEAFCAAANTPAPVQAVDYTTTYAPSPAPLPVVPAPTGYSAPAPAPVYAPNRQ